MTARPMKWIKAVDIGPSKSGKTRLFTIVALAREETILGEVRWYGPWRCYAFFPAHLTIFEKDCLRDIADFCAEKTKEHNA